jgi:hypothetical protein
MENVSWVSWQNIHLKLSAHPAQAGSTSSSSWQYIQLKLTAHPTQAGSY